jgi:demethylmenaquinone methyltransferase / 2-methoxy-6-polyprenyl-1,4-benzoquinol methylase
MPAIGGFISGNREAYTYLPETSAKFPAGEKFLDLMDEPDVFSESEAEYL